MGENIYRGIPKLDLPVQLGLELPHEQGLVIDAVEDEGKAQADAENHYKRKCDPPKKLSTHSRHTVILPYGG